MRRGGGTRFAHGGGEGKGPAETMGGGTEGGTSATPAAAVAGTIGFSLSKFTRAFITHAAPKRSSGPACI